MISISNELSLNNKIRLIKEQFIVHNDIENYVINLVKDINVNITGDYIGNFIEIMQNGLFDSWCWQTTATAILFFSDTDCVERGYLKYGKYSKYFHSWISFNYEGINYVFDPCFNLICKKDIYYKIFDLKLEGMCVAKEVKKYFINNYMNPPKKELNLTAEEQDFIDRFFKRLGPRKDKGVYISGGNDPNEPMFRNHVTYNAYIKDDKIKKIDVHYYLC